MWWVSVCLTLIVSLVRSESLSVWVSVCLTLFVFLYQSASLSLSVWIYIYCILYVYICRESWSVCLYKSISFCLRLYLLSVLRVRCIYLIWMARSVCLSLSIVNNNSPTVKVVTNKPVFTCLCSSPALFAEFLQTELKQANLIILQRPYCLEFCLGPAAGLEIL